MILSIGIVLLLGVLCAKFLDKINIPSFLGFLLIGVLIGPYIFNILNHEFIGYTQEIATLAMVILLLRAGLGLSKDSMKKVGRVAVEMSCIPGILEGLSIAFIGSVLLGISVIEGGMLGFILAAVSPAILVPRMIKLIEKGRGTKKGIPEILMAGSSADDVVAITIFSIFLGMWTGGQINIAWSIASIPIALLLGVLFGVVCAAVLIYVFKKWEFKDIEKLFITLATGILLNALGEALQGKIPIAGLVGVMVIGFLLLDRAPKVAIELSNKYNHLWLAAEILIFVLLGAQLNLSLLIQNVALGPIEIPLVVMGIIVVTIGVLFRYLGVQISLAGSNLNMKERLFCMLAYTPKANVQATIGAVPLATAMALGNTAGIATGQLILAITAISIIYTAPLGAVFISFFSTRLLDVDPEYLKYSEEASGK
ncbi:cation:proton antiporter [Methanobrevibacter curvatus]|uniref:K(+)/H(+) antiporter NhaP2 n=1 Tax=Methanobrevibacter curvatus TaxID=49547 RepID=A0A165ZQC3_9EURY|nr:cation:proton antiporter [Methanobrevibacter curvatus]KZX11024.1 K(+)/H(+) antiporter NhaP2 [Methanobrevibacter curvatus]